MSTQKPTTNIFCATGENGGVDPTCRAKTSLAKFLGPPLTTEQLQARTNKALALERTAKGQPFGYKAAEIYIEAAKAHKHLDRLKGGNKYHKEQKQRLIAKAKEIVQIMDTGRSMDMAQAMKGLKLTKGQVMKVELGLRTGRTMTHPRHLVVRDKNGKEIYKSKAFVPEGGNIKREAELEQNWLLGAFDKWAGSYQALTHNSDTEHTCKEKTFRISLK